MAARTLCWLTLCPAMRYPSLTTLSRAKLSFASFIALDGMGRCENHEGTTFTPVLHTQIFLMMLWLEVSVCCGCARQARHWEPDLDKPRRMDVSPRQLGACQLHCSFRGTKGSRVTWVSRRFILEERALFLDTHWVGCVR